MIQVQPRDVEIIRLVDTFRYVSTSQIARLFFGTRRRAQARLRQLHQAGLLGYATSLVTRGRGERVWFVTKRASDILPGETVTCQRIARKELTFGFLRHKLAVVDVYIAFLEAAREVGGTMEWLAERQASEKFIGSRGEVWVRPDGFLRLELPDREPILGFVEVDLSSITLSRMVQRFQAYYEYVATGRYQARYPEAVRANGIAMWILVICDTESRARRLLEVWGQEVAMVSLPVFYSDLARVKENPLGRIWLRQLDRGEKWHAL